MKITWLVGIVSVAVALQFMPRSAQAFECPKHFLAAQAAIDKAWAEMEGMKGKISKEEHALVHALLDDAKMRLDGAKHNHQEPQGAYDHARAIARGESALWWAKSAHMLQVNYMQK